MFTRTLLLGYWCPICHSLEPIKKLIYISSVNSAVDISLSEYTSIKLRCPECFSEEPMKLIYIRCDAIESYDEFGVSLTNTVSYGSTPYWACSKDEGHIGKNKAVYPIPLKRAYEESMSYKTVYKQIIEKGYPWRCPTCDSRLQLRF